MALTRPASDVTRLIAPTLRSHKLGGRIGKADGGALSFDDLPSAAPAAPAAAKPAGDLSFDDLPAKPQPSSGIGDFLKSIPRGALAGFSDAASALGKATAAEMGQHEMAEEIPSGPQGTELLEKNMTGALHKPQGTAGRFGASVGSVMGSPASWVGPGGILPKAVMAVGSGLGSEAGGELAQGTAMETPARVIGGMLGGPLAARAVKPQLAPAQQMLADHGITQMTPGQLTGGLLKDFEDKLTSVPILGHFIQNARGRSIQGFNRAVANQALEPIGETLARGTPAGHATIDEVATKLGNAYDRLVPNIHFVPDADFAHDLSQIRQSASTMPATNVRQFNRILEDRLAPGRWVHQVNLPQAAAPGSNTLGQTATHLWGLQGPQYKSIESELTHLAGRYGKSSDAGQQLLGDHLRDVVTAMRNNLERSNPVYREELGRINQGWAMYARMRGAAANRRGSEGVFSPGDLLTAIRRGDTSVQKGSFARGNALMQDFAEAGQHVLPSSVPDSGTPGRALSSIVTGGGLGFLSPKVLAGVGALTTPYLTPSMALLNRYVRPTTGARADYANMGRSMMGNLRPLLSTLPNPYAP